MGTKIPRGPHYCKLGGGVRGGGGMLTQFVVDHMIDM